ncbi:hypothetical protein E3P96_02831 [Wallemia ichthyophaga]|nr:hypothetical protein E3P96_02831 [Wallemia ichthyophaga]
MNSNTKLPHQHFLSQRSLTYSGSLDCSTLAAADFDVDPRSAFLPPEEPLRRLSECYDIWELALDSAQNLPLLLDGANNEVSNTWRNAICGMSVLEPPTIPSDGIRSVRRAYTVLSFLAHFFVHSQPAHKKQTTQSTQIIPRSIAIPWHTTALALGLPPILTYASTVLWNWEYIDKSKGLRRGNLRAPLTFTQSRDEEHFYLTSAHIEVEGRLCLERMSQCLDEAFMADVSPQVSFPRMCRQLTDLAAQINVLTEILVAVRAECSPEVFYTSIRRWFNGPNGEGKWHYEGVDPLGVYRDYGGPSAGQSSLIHAIDAFLGVNHAPVDDEADFDDTFMRRMQTYMPDYHRRFLNHLKCVEPSCRDVVGTSLNADLQSAYNGAIEAMKKLRSEHIKIATLYVVTQSRKAEKESDSNSANVPESRDTDIKDYDDCDEYDDTINRIEIGRLVVLGDEGAVVFGKGDPGKQPQATITVKNHAFWVRLLLMNDVGFSEAYMFGDIDVDDLTSVFKIFIANRKHLAEMSTLPSYLYSWLAYALNTRFANSITNTRRNISAHYDISNDMFTSFLSPDMTYSCGIYEDPKADTEVALALTGSNGSNGSTTNNGSTTSNSKKKQKTHKLKLNNNGRTLANGDAVNEGDDLHAAQLRKLHTIIHKTSILPNMRLLEIGSGWGSFAIEACKLYPSLVVDTLTLSTAQKELAEQRISDAGLSNRIRVHLCDYRNMPQSWHANFDRVVSIEMIEAVGIEYLARYFDCLDWALNDNGIAVIQAITIPEGRFGAYVKNVDFIRKYIFPGGVLPSLTALFDTLLEGTKGKLVVDNVVQIGPHYSRTLRDWRRAFEASFDTHIRHHLALEHKGLSDEAIEVFRRKWVYYFTYCEAGFDARAIGDHILTITRESNPQMFTITIASTANTAIHIKNAVQLTNFTVEGCAEVC